MKVIAWILVGFGFAGQLFFSFSILIMPSMASVEGVAAYPPALVLLLEFLYRVAPYAVFGTVLAIAGNRSPAWAAALYSGVILAVISPLLVALLSTATPLTASTLGAWFWPLRPAIQLAVFVSVAAAGWLVGSVRVQHPAT